VFSFSVNILHFRRCRQANRPHLRVCLPSKQTVDAKDSAKTTDAATTTALLLSIKERRRRRRRRRERERDRDRQTDNERERKSERDREREYHLDFH